MPVIRILSFVFFLAVGVWSHNGFDLLLRNETQKAIEQFQQQAKNQDPIIKGRALRGLAMAYENMGQDSLAAHFFLQSYLTDGDADHLMVNLNGMLGSLRRAAPELRDFWKQALQRLRQENPTHPLLSELTEEMGYYELLDKSPAELLAYHQQAQPVRHWKMVGPFDNVSGSGNMRVLGPEKGFQFKERYTGFAGQKLQWVDFQVRAHNGWALLDQRQGLVNALNFFATHLESPVSQTVTLHFGVSGVFTLWVNGEPVAHSDVFQNTGREGYRIQTVLRQGSNSILLKLGHEQGNYSNFILRVTDSLGVPLELPAQPKPQKAVQKAKKQSRVLEPTLVGRFSARADSAPSDPEALMQLVRHHVSREEYLPAKRLLRVLLERYPQSAWVAALMGNMYAREGNNTLATFQYERALQLDTANGIGWAYAYRQRVVQESWQEAYTWFHKRPLYTYLSASQMVNHVVTCYHLARQREMQAWLDSLLARSGIDAQLQAAEILGNLGDQSRALQLVQKAQGQALLGTHWVIRRAFRLRAAARSAEAIQFLELGLQYYPDASDLWNRLADFHFQEKSYESSIVAAKRGLEVNPLHVGLYKLLGQSYEVTGQKNKALEYYRHALRIGRQDFELSDHVRELQNQKNLRDLAYNFDMFQLVRESRQWAEGRQDNSLILLNQCSLLAHNWGGFEIQDRLLVEVLDPQGVDDWKEYEVAYESNYEKLRVVRAVSIKPDGKTLPAESNGAQLVFATLVPGDLIEVVVARQFSFPGQIAGQFWAKHAIQSTVPVWISHFEIMAPTSHPYQTIQSKVNIKPQRKKRDGLEVQTFEARKILAQRAESFMPPWSDALSWVQVSSVPHWRFIADWYHGLTQGKTVATPELRSFADSLFAGATTEDEKMRRVHAFITSEVRYSYMSFRQSGFVPQAASKTLSTLMGDCKDMATLAKALLELGGVSSDLVLVNTNDDGRARVLPTVEFNHCILRSQSGVYVDYTASHSGWRHLPRSDQGARALVTAPSLGDSLRWLPWQSSEQEYTHRLSHDTLFADGSFARHLETRRGGAFAAMARGWYRFQNPERVRLDVLRSVQKWYPGAELTLNQIEGLDSIDSEVRHVYAFRSRLAGWQGGKTLCMPVPWADDVTAAALPGEPKRHFNYEFWRNWLFYGSYSHTMNLVLPKGWKLLDVPESKIITGSFGRYQVEFHLKGSVLEAKRTFLTQVQDVSPAAYPAFRAELERVLQADRTMLVLVPQGT